MDLQWGIVQAEIPWQRGGFLAWTILLWIVFVWCHFVQGFADFLECSAEYSLVLEPPDSITGRCLPLSKFKSPIAHFLRSMQTTAYIRTWILTLWYLWSGMVMMQRPTADEGSWLHHGARLLWGGVHGIPKCWATSLMGLPQQQRRLINWTSGLSIPSWSFKRDIFSQLILGVSPMIGAFQEESWALTGQFLFSSKGMKSF